MRPLVFIIFTLTLAACKQSISPKILLSDNLKFSAYYWLENETNNTWELYLDHYIGIDKNANFVLMRHNKWRSQPEYFSGTLDDTICLLINSTFLNNNYDSDYTHRDNPVMYHGFTYCFDYKSSEKAKILYIPPYSPSQISILGSVLDSLIYKTNKSKTDSFSLVNYINVLKQIDSLNLPRSVEFVPPKSFQ